MALSLPRKYVDSRIDALELEVENIMEEVEQDSYDQQQSGAATAGVNPASGTIPTESSMQGHSKKLMTKVCLSGVGTCPKLDRPSATHQFITSIAVRFWIIGLCPCWRSDVRSSPLAKCGWNAGTLALLQHSTIRQIEPSIYLSLHRSLIF